MRELHIFASPRSRKLKRFERLAAFASRKLECNPDNNPGGICFEVPESRADEAMSIAASLGIESVLGIGGVVFNACFALGDYLFAPADDNFLHVWNISDPASPASVGSVNIGGSGQGIWLVNSVCYTVDNNGLLVVTNIDDPAAPFVEPDGVAETGENWSHIRAVGDIAVLSGAGASFVALYDLGIRPPRLIQSTDTENPTTPVGSQAAFQGDRLFFGDTTGNPRALLRNYRIGGFFCSSIGTYDLYAESQVTTEMLRARHGYFGGEVVADSIAAVGGDGDTEAGSLSAEAYIQIGAHRILPVTGNPNGVVTAPIGSIGLSDSGAVYRNTDGAMAWTAM